MVLEPPRAEAEIKQNARAEATATDFGTPSACKRGRSASRGDAPHFEPGAAPAPAQRARVPRHSAELGAPAFHSTLQRRWIIHGQR